MIGGHLHTHGLVPHPATILGETGKEANLASDLAGVDLASVTSSLAPCQGRERERGKRRA